MAKIGDIEELDNQGLFLLGDMSESYMYKKDLALLLYESVHAQSGDVRKTFEKTVKISKEKNLEEILISKPPKGNVRAPSPLLQIPLSKSKNYVTRHVGYSIEFEDRNKILCFSPSDTIIGALMTSSIDEIYEKVFGGFRNNWYEIVTESKMNEFADKFDEKYKKHGTELEKVIYDKTIMPYNGVIPRNLSSEWQGLKEHFKSRAGNFNVPSLGKEERPVHRISIKNPPEQMKPEYFTNYVQSCECGKHFWGSLNQEGKEIVPGCRHVEASAIIVNKGLGIPANVSIHKNENVRIPQVFEPLTNLRHPLVRKFLELYYLKNYDKRTCDLFLCQFPEQILHPNMLKYLVENFNKDYGKQKIIERYPLTNSNVENHVYSPPFAAIKNGVGFYLDMRVSYIKC